MWKPGRQQALAELISVVEALNSEIAIGRSGPAALARVPQHHNEVLRARLCGQRVRPSALRPGPLLRHCRARLAARQVREELATVLVAIDTCNNTQRPPYAALQWLVATWRVRGKAQ
jgi:hypothetical protein